MNAQTHMLRQTAGMLVAVLLMAGCTTTSRQSATNAADAIKALQQRMTTGEQQMNSTVVALVNLVNKPQPDVRPQYQTFVENLDKLEAQIKKGRSERAALTTQSDAYFAKWEQDTQNLQNEQLKNAALSRRNAVQGRFNNISSEFKTAKPTFDMFMRDLREIKQALGFDLTPGGITAIKPIVQKVQNEAVIVRKSISAIRTELGRVSSEMATTAPGGQ
jgi:hypothetical protein